MSDSAGASNPTNLIGLLQHHAGHEHVKHPTSLRRRRQHNGQKLTRRHGHFITPHLHLAMLHSQALSTFAFILALLVSVVCFLLSPFFVRDLSFDTNFDSYTLHNCIHISHSLAPEATPHHCRTWYFFGFIFYSYMTFLRFAGHFCGCPPNRPPSPPLPPIRIAYANPLSAEVHS